MVGHAGGVGSPGVGLHRNHRPPRVAQRHRREPDGDRRSLRRGGGAGSPLLRSNRPARSGRRQAGSGGEPPFPGRGRDGNGGDPRRLHLRGRNPGGGRRPGRGAGGGRPHTRGGGSGGPGSAGADRASSRRRLAAGPRRPSGDRPPAPRNGAPQPPLQPQQLGRLRRPGPLLQPGGPGHRRHRRQHDRGVPAGLRDAAFDGRDRLPRNGLGLAGDRMEAGPRMPG